jgi:hypothetical protein
MIVVYKIISEVNHRHGASTELKANRGFDVVPGYSCSRGSRTTRAGFIHISPGTSSPFLTL